MPKEKQTHHRKLENDSTDRDTGRALSIGAGVVILMGVLHGMMNDSAIDSKRDTVPNDPSLTTVGEIQKKYHSELNRIAMIERDQMSVDELDTQDWSVGSPSEAPTIHAEGRAAGIIPLSKAALYEPIGKDQRLPGKVIGAPAKSLSSAVDVLKTRNK